MKKNRLAQSLVLMTALVLGAGLNAMASTVNLQFTWTGSLWESGFSGNYIQSDDAIGIYAFNQWGTPQQHNNSVANPLYSVCLSPAGLLDGGQYTYNIESFSTAGRGIFPTAWAVGAQGQPYGINNAAWLWNTFGMKVVNNTGGAYSGNQSVAAAALEFAIWTALYDSTGYGKLDVGIGSTWQQPPLTDPTATYYNTFIDDLTSLTSSARNGSQFTGNILEGQGALGYPYNGQTGQSQEFFLLGTPVPEPTTMVVGALLLLPFGASTMRMFRKSRRA